MGTPVNCPCCQHEIFSVGALNTDPLIVGSNGVVFDSDEHGTFMRCPHCSKRVVFVPAPSLVGTGFRLADTQPCADC